MVAPHRSLEETMESAPEATATPKEIENV